MADKCNVTIFSQSKGLNSSIAYIYAENIFIRLGTGLSKHSLGEKMSDLGPKSAVFIR